VGKGKFEKGGLAGIYSPLQKGGLFRREGFSYLTTFREENLSFTALPTQGTFLV